MSTVTDYTDAVTTDSATLSSSVYTHLKTLNLLVYDVNEASDPDKLLIKAVDLKDLELLQVRCSQLINIAAQLSNIVTQL